MWCAVFLLVFFSADFYQFFASAEGFYSEGGSFNQQRPLNDADYSGAKYAPTQQRYYLQQEQNERYLQNIVDQLRNQRNTRVYDNNYYHDYPTVQQSEEPSNEDETLAELEELQKFSEKIKQLEEGGADNFGVPETFSTNADVPADRPVTANDKLQWQTSERPLSAQKKGQSEFVEFVEPRVSKVLSGVELMEKRGPIDSSARRGGYSHPFGFVMSNGNVVFLAFVAMCCVIVLVGIVGGTYYWNHARNVREDPFDDFTRYSPAGPGRDRFKKGGGNSPLGGHASEKGDDALAYKAQLHHYQQTKQKIIGGDGGGVPNVVGAPGADLTDRSDDEDDGVDLEHNFSVYECPGLAPTGDIEVQNPNFIESAHK